LASGGYIIRIRPIAIGMFVVPTDTRSRAAPIPGTNRPSSTPNAIARKIQSVRNRSRKPSRPGSAVAQGVFGESDPESGGIAFMKHWSFGER
jgi:hypothetical protein